MKSSSAYANSNSPFSFWQRRTTSFARASPPFEPSAQTVDKRTFTPSSSHLRVMKSISLSVSVGKRFIATTQGSLNTFLMFETWRKRLGIPFSRASIFSVARSCFCIPPCILRARTVATTTTASGTRFAFLHLMSKNFSAPRSAPKPASVTV